LAGKIKHKKQKGKKGGWKGNGHRCTRPKKQYRECQRSTPIGAKESIKEGNWWRKKKLNCWRGTGMGRAQGMGWKKDLCKETVVYGLGGEMM